MNKSAKDLAGVLFRASKACINVARRVSDKFLLPAGRLVLQHWQARKQQTETRFRDRVVDSNTYDPEKARDWERFRKGKSNSGYLDPDN